MYPRRNTKIIEHRSANVKTPEGLGFRLASPGRSVGSQFSSILFRVARRPGSHLTYADYL